MESSFAEYDQKNRMKNTKMELHLAVIVIGVMLFTFSVGSYLAEISMDVARRSVHDNLITLAIKFQNFLVAKLFQFRYLAPLETASSFMSIAFWVVLTRGNLILRTRVLTEPSSSSNSVNIHCLQA